MRFTKYIFSMVSWGMASMLYAATQAAFNLIPTTPTSANLGLNHGVANVIYQVTNVSNKTRTIVMQPISGVTQITDQTGTCANPFSLAPGQSCLLSLRITAEVQSGPVVCKTRSAQDHRPDPLLCSQPSLDNSLKIYKNTCDLFKFNFNFSRYPIQTDPNATYFAAIISQQNISQGKKPELIIQDDFPQSTYFSINIYDINGNYYSGITDSEISVFSPNINPWIVGNLVLGIPRNFTVDTLTSSVLQLPPADQNPLITVVMRVYAPINGQDYSPNPLILEGGLTCGASKSVTSTGLGTVPQTLPLPIDNVTSDYLNDISFYNIGQTLYGDGKSGYLGTSLYPDNIAILEVPQFPSFFNTTNITSTSTYPLVDVQYISLGSYGSSFATNNVLDGNLTGLIGSAAYYVLIPQSFLLIPEYAQLVSNGCGDLNILVLQPSGEIDNLPPYIIFREKAPLSSFPGIFNQVPVFENGQFNNMTTQDKITYAAQNYISVYAPIGHQCTSSQFMNNACGYTDVSAQLASCGF